MAGDQPLAWSKLRVPCPLCGKVIGLTSELDREFLYEGVASDHDKLPPIASKEWWQCQKCGAPIGLLGRLVGSMSNSLGSISVQKAVNMRANNFKLFCSIMLILAATGLVVRMLEYCFS